MISRGWLQIGTGDDDLRAGSRVVFRVVMPYRRDLTVEVAGGRRFEDRTDTERLAWRLDESVEIGDIQRFEIEFTADRRTAMFDDDWEFVRLAVWAEDDETGAEIELIDSTFRHKFDDDGVWRSDILPTFDRSTSSTITVTDVSGDPVGGADVWSDYIYTGLTDSAGQVTQFTLDADSVVAAMRLLHEQGTYRGAHSNGSHRDWNYRVYETSVTIGDDGIADPTVTRVGNGAQVVVRPTNIAIGVNLVVSVDFDLGEPMSRVVRRMVTDMSARLWDATDGQFFVDQMTLHHRHDHWDDADLRILADRGLRANVPGQPGGFLGWNVAGTSIHVHIDNPPEVVAHEFGHFGLDLWDEYDEDDRTRHCTDALGSDEGAFGLRQPHASCIMDQAYTAPKLCSGHEDNPHVRGTEQGDTPCWDHVVERYEREGPWTLKTPTTRNVILGTITGIDARDMSGPYRQPVFIDERTENLPGLVLAPFRLMARDAAGVGVWEVDVSTRDTEGTWREQGFTAFGALTLHGIHVGDTVRIEYDGTAQERTVPPGATTMEFTV